MALMQILCPACHASYAAELYAPGDDRQVRCAHCSSAWSVPAPAATVAIGNRKRRNHDNGRVIAALLGLLLGLGYAREDVVRLLPQMASLYATVGLPVNLRGLVFQDLKIARDAQGEVPSLVLEGIIRNVTDSAVKLPGLRFAMRDAAGAEIYTWSAQPERATLPPGETQIFRAPIASPPAESREVSVRFLHRRDLVGGAR